jgi:hypothetical protein
VNGQTLLRNDEHAGGTTRSIAAGPTACAGNLCKQYGRGRERSTFYLWYMAFELGDGFSLESLI